ncbi:MAG: FkbM family methyltransferase [Candidatus Omnitrophica bacterium]|nr:FkbM family methyltransferase [Candidatus Omnitrophota bacterium]
MNRVLVIYGRKFFIHNFNDLLHISPLFEIQILDWFKRFTGKANVFIDVGAHIGKYTILLAPLFKRVVSVEPDPYNFWILRKNVLLNGFGNVVLFRCGCFSANGEGVLYLSPINFGSYSLKDSIVSAGKVRICLRKLDDIIEEAGISCCDVRLVKIDVEGVEKDVLLGACKLLSIGRPNIIVETLDFGEVFGILSSYGYRPVDVDMFGHNFLFVKS